MPSKSYKKRSMSKKNKKTLSKRKSKKSQRGGRPSRGLKGKSQSSSGSYATPMSTESPGRSGRYIRPVNKALGSRGGRSSQGLMFGGSPAYDLVMEATTNTPVLNDNFPRTSDNSSCQTGGSAASDMVNMNLSDVAQTVPYPTEKMVSGDMNSMNTYDISGGKRRGSNGRQNKMSRKNKSQKNKNKSNNNKSQKNKNKNKSKSKSKSNNNKTHMMRGGHASDWLSSQYSQGSINGSSMASNTGDFSVSQGSARDILMNPPTLGLAGSGYPMGTLEGANVKSLGAPLI
jgi:hypothetical protein